MSSYLDMAAWPRQRHFHFFRGFDRPFFNICAKVDVTELKAAVASDRSFFLASLFVSTKAANDIECFRYRLRGEKVWIHDKVDAGSTVLLPDDTFGFAYFDFCEDFARFHSEASAAIRSLQSGAIDAFDPRDDRDDLLHYSVIPWISFTSFAHARRFDGADSVPKIVFGRYDRAGDRLQMPVAVEVHHALMDGLDVGRYFNLFQDYLDRPNEVLGLRKSMSE